MTLIADRFVRGQSGAVFDLATGHRVTLVERTLTSILDQRAHRERCEAAMETWRSDQPSLVDYALVGEARWIEAYATASTHTTTGTSASACRSSPRRVRRWSGSAAACDAEAVRGALRGAGGRSVRSDGLGGCCGRAGDLRTWDIESASIARSDSRPRVEIRLLVPPALHGVVAALDAVRGTGDLRRLFVTAPRGAGLTTFLLMAACEVRRRGFVPICPDAVRAWPAIVRALRGRSVVLIADRSADRSADRIAAAACDRDRAGAAIGGFATALALLARAGCAVSAVIVAVPDSARGAALSLQPLSPHELASRVTIHGDAFAPRMLTPDTFHAGVPAVEGARRANSRQRVAADGARPAAVQAGVGGKGATHREPAAAQDVVDLLALAHDAEGLPGRFVARLLQLPAGSWPATRALRAARPPAGLARSKEPAARTTWSRAAESEPPNGASGGYADPWPARPSSTTVAAPARAANRPSCFTNPRRGARVER